MNLIKNIAVRVFAATIGLLQNIGLLSPGLPKQPGFKLFSLTEGTYIGGLIMTTNTDWEMHPIGDEALTLLSGRIDVVLRRDDQEEVIELQPHRSFIVPEGIWHRQIIHQPSSLLFMTQGAASTKHEKLEPL